MTRIRFSLNNINRFWTIELIPGLLGKFSMGVTNMVQDVDSALIALYCFFFFLIADVFLGEPIAFSRNQLEPFQDEGTKHQSKEYRK